MMIYTFVKKTIQSLIILTFNFTFFRRFIPVTMAQAKIYWDLENYAQAETIFYKSVEFCNENDTWRLHVAHVLFMQEKFKEAIAFYEPIVKKNYNNVINTAL